MNNKRHRTWRDIARPIIQEVLRRTKDEADYVRKDALKQAYPFGQRQYHPYKIWLDEIKVQTGKRRFGKRNNIVPENQGKLF